MSGLFFFLLFVGVLKDTHLACVFDVLAVKVFVDREHGGGGFSVRPSVFLDDARDLAVKHRHMPHFLGGEEIEHVRKRAVGVFGFERTIDMRNLCASSLRL